MATKRCRMPVWTSRSIMATRPSSWRPTASLSPALLMENCLGPTPPAGKICARASAPVAGSTVKVAMESDLIALPEPSKLGMVKDLSNRFETIRKRLSG